MAFLQNPETGVIRIVHEEAFLDMQDALNAGWEIIGETPPAEFNVLQEPEEEVPLFLDEMRAVQPLAEPIRFVEPFPTFIPEVPLIPLQQEVPFMPTATNGAQPVSEVGGVPVPVPQDIEGADLRDGGGVPGLAAVPAVAGPLVALALRILRAAMGGVTTVTSRHWNSLPGWARTALAGLGIGVGFDLVRDLPGVPGASSLLDQGGDGVVHLPQHLVDGHLGTHILGSWVANNVTFYRLSDGKLAVRNNKGRWKVWRPKKPIVLMPGGAGNLRTLLRADAVLNRQAKKIAAMLNRRTGNRSRKATTRGKPDVVVVQNGRVAQIDP